MANKLMVVLMIALPAAGYPSAASAGEKSGTPTHYESAWESLEQYSAPAWFEDAKFGIFIHWGVYSVPAYGSEWYPRDMYIDYPPEREQERPERYRSYEHHRETYGPHKEFGYKDFVPMFKAEKWDPRAWVKLFRKAGAKYVVPVGEHHDGFALYDSSHTRWDSVDMGPHRDIVGELSEAARKRGMHFGVSTHYAHNWKYFTYNEAFDTVDPAYAGLYNKDHDPKDPPSQEHIEHWYARTVEIVDKYRPEILWFDFGFLAPEYDRYRKEIAAYYYNKGIEWGKGVVLQYKKEGYPPGIAVLDIERGKLNEVRDMVWQTDTAVSKKSWGYIKDDEFKSVDRLVDDLADIVSKNGCLLLNVGPRPDGTIPQEAVDILLGIGKWLDLNGEAIYGTRPWHTFGEGPTKSGGHLQEKRDTPYTAEDIRFTTKGKNLYAICLDWPGEEVIIRSLSSGSPLDAEKIKRIRMLGARKKLTWSQSEEGLTIQLPKERPCDNAYVIKIALKQILEPA